METLLNTTTAAFYAEKGWSIADTLALEGRQGKTVACTTIGKLMPQSLAYLHGANRDQIYMHQRLAIQCALMGKNVCIATGTASGKTLAFQVAAIEDLAQHPKHRIIAIYPTRALAKEQEDRWYIALKQAGLDARVGRIDGQVNSALRLSILRDANILIMTPDIIHAWLFSHINEHDIACCLQHLSLLIVDEVHTYTGVFGSNAAFLFRRLQHVCALLQAQPHYIAASATIAEPQQHLHKLFGQHFEIIESTHDSSPKHPVSIQLVTPPDGTDLFTAITDLLHELVAKTDFRFITFVDSRKQVEQLSTIVARPQDDQEPEEEELFEARLDRFERMQVLPFRAGYEEQDRDKIQARLGSDSLRGVISTSALELGMDIQNLNIAVLVGVPRSATSLMQRIGRIGRHAPGHVIVINTRNVYDEAIFRRPQDFLHRPLAEGALYLENERIQYIHALCLARLGGEHDQVQAALKREDADFTSPIDWPLGFLTLCAKERLGEIPTDLQSIKIEGGDTPEVTYPLRDVESSFHIELKQGGDLGRLGSLSFSQVLREAYPGAVYYYIAQPYRIYRVQVNTKTIYARKEKRYTTRPIALPTRIFPNFSQGSLFQNSAYGQLQVAECALQVSESLVGVKERRGRNEFNAHYPMPYDTGISFTLPYFKRNFFSTGILLSHPVFNETDVECDLLANLIYEAFLIHVPFERQDINVAVDKHGTQRGDIPKGSRFITIYDQTYGSLRLSRRLLLDNALQDTLEYALMLSEDPNTYSGNPATRAALELLCREARETPRQLSLGDFDTSLVSNEIQERVILPGSRGVDVKRNNEEFVVESVYFHPKIQGLAYRGKHITFPDPTAQEYVSIRDIAEIPGESAMGFYNYDTGETTPI
jgi:DEAD/DEAH box helicase domain-containing protein